MTPTGTRASVRRCATSAETTAEGERIAEGLGPGAVVLLVGPLGAGKTTLAKGIARGLGVEGEIISPTYTIVSEYQGRMPLYHVDLYRIEGSDQIENLGLDDFLWGQGVSLVEWGEKLEGAIPGPHLRVGISLAADGAREVTVDQVAGRRLP